jgi:hypothetical protein
VKSMSKCRKDECIYIYRGFLSGVLRDSLGNTGNRSSLSRPHKRSGDNVDYDRVFEIALGILIALAIGWAILKYGSFFLRYGLVAVVVMLFVYIAMLILRILRG